MYGIGSLNRSNVRKTGRRASLLLKESASSPQLSFFELLLTLIDLRRKICWLILPTEVIKKKRIIILHVAHLKLHSSQKLMS
jgi:hypothetical protein